MSNVRDLHRKWRRDPAYREAYDALDTEFTLTRSLIEARLAAGLTQAQLAERMETTQSVVARLEGGQGNPSTRTLEALARSTGTRLRISFEPVDPFADASIDELVDRLRRKLPLPHTPAAGGEVLLPQGRENAPRTGRRLPEPGVPDGSAGVRTREVEDGPPSGELLNEKLG